MGEKQSDFDAFNFLRIMKSFLKRPDCRRYICKSSLEKLCLAIAPKLCNSSEIFLITNGTHLRALTGV